MDDENSAAYFNERIDIPEALRRQFESVMQMRRFHMNEELASMLCLRSDALPVIVGQVFDELLGCLAKVARDEPPADEYRGTDVADKALARFTFYECVSIAEYFGWSADPVGPHVTLGTTDRVVHQIIGERFGKKINRTLARWAKDGLLGRYATRRI